MCSESVMCVCVCVWGGGGGSNMNVQYTCNIIGTWVLGQLFSSEARERGAGPS